MIGELILRERIRRDDGTPTTTIGIVGIVRVEDCVAFEEVLGDYGLEFIDGASEAACGVSVRDNEINEILKFCLELPSTRRSSTLYSPLSMVCGKVANASRRLPQPPLIGHLFHHRYYVACGS